MRRRVRTGLSITNEHGVVLLLLCYLVALFLMTVGTAASVVGTNELRIAQRQSQAGQAFQLAETGLDAALVQLRNGNTNSINSTSFGNGSYNATITQPAGVASNQFLVTGIGTSNGTTRSLEAVVERNLLNPFRGPVLGDRAVRIDGSVVTTSWDSARGNYYSTWAETQAGLRTNSTENAAIRINGSGIIGGDLEVGLHGDVSRIQTTGAVIVRGRRRVAPETIPLETKTPPSNCRQLGRENEQGDVVINGTMTVVGGTYCVTRRLELRGTSVLQFTGPATVFTPELKASGAWAIVAADNKPTNLAVNITGTQQVDLSGSKAIWGTLHAKRAKVQMTGSMVLNGAVAAQEVEIRGSASIRYDRALQRVGGTTLYSTAIRSWQDL